jgi:hypothetical protein
LLLLTTGLQAGTRASGRRESLNVIRERVRQGQPLLVHAVVALADNVHQGIVPVPAKLGNGDDPGHNLYWGARYGVKAYFLRSPGWKLIGSEAPEGSAILERVVFRGRIAGRTVYLVAEAYRGSRIQSALEDFLRIVAGRRLCTHKVENGSMEFCSKAGLVAYVGHNGLMEIELDELPRWQKDSGQRDAIVLACLGRSYFTKPIRKAGAYPLLWSTGLMAAEAYTLRAAVEGWVRAEDAGSIRNRAARAYAKYQKWNLDAAKRLLVSGWK